MKPPRFITDATNRVLLAVAAERERQERKFPGQELPHGDPRPGDRTARDLARSNVDRLAAEGRLTWRDVLDEEVLESAAEQILENRRAGLVQVAATAVRQIEQIDRETAELVITCASVDELAAHLFEESADA